MTLLVPILPLMDTVVAEPDSRLPHGIRYWSTDLKALVADYLALGVQWVHFQDLEGLRLGRLVESCSVTEVAVVKELVVSVEGGIRTWQTARTYLSQAVDLVYLGRADGWSPPFQGIGQREVERRVLFEFPVEASDLDKGPNLRLALDQATAIGVVPVLTGTLPLPDLVRIGNLAGVAARRRLVLRPQRLESLEEWSAGLALTGGYVQAVMLEHRVLDRLGIHETIDCLRGA